jgi:hypothetical protein
MKEATMNEIQWPVRPTCHDGDFQAQRFGNVVWRPKGEKLHPTNDPVMAFRTCSYCGSIHPEDLIEALRAGASLGGADWKYGWPHKFYVDKIPNPNVGQLVRRTSTSIAGAEPTAAERESMARWAKSPGSEVHVVANGFSPHDGSPRYSLAVFEPDGATTHGKWYNEHLKDLEPEAFAELATLLQQRAGIGFIMENGKLKFGAPSVGYQA